MTDVKTAKVHFIRKGPISRMALVAAATAPPLTVAACTTATPTDTATADATPTDATPTAGGAGSDPATTEQTSALLGIAPERVTSGHRHGAPHMS